MSRLRWAGRARLVQLTTLVVGVALLALVVWSVTRPQPPTPAPISGTWLGEGSVYDSTGGGVNQLAILMNLTQASDGSVIGEASECNDVGQSASFQVVGVAQGNALTLQISGADLQGRRAGGAYALSGSVNGSSIVLTLRAGNAADFATACKAISHVDVSTVP